MPDAAYHLVERDFGRFARAVRLSGAFDIARARATLDLGELTVILPKLLERRGRAHRVPVTASDAPAA
jgi:HSP20 family molecular chaperone IbpA